MLGPSSWLRRRIVVAKVVPNTYSRVEGELFGVGERPTLTWEGVVWTTSCGLYSQAAKLGQMVKSNLMGSVTVTEYVTLLSLRTLRSLEMSQLNHRAQSDSYAVEAT